MVKSRAQNAETPEVLVLLISAREWFGAALRAVLEPEGFSLLQAHTRAAALVALGESDPDILILDQGLPDGDAPSLCRELLAGPLAESTPVIVYSPDLWQESEQVAAWNAGAWDVIREPVRSALLIARLRRALSISKLIGMTKLHPSPETSLLDADSLRLVFALFEALAVRDQRLLSCVLIGPTVPSRGEESVREREVTGQIVLNNTRACDPSGWFGDTDVAILAYDTNTTGATTLVNRLAQLASVELGSAARSTMSAGIVQVSRPSVASGRAVKLEPFAAAREALAEARRAGGGVRVGDS